MNQQNIIVKPLIEVLTEYANDESVLFILSNTSVKKMSSDCQELLCNSNAMCLYTTECKYDDILQILSEKSISTVIGLGGGTAIDFAKYVSKHLCIKCVAIPSMLSTNVFATNKVAVFTETEKHTEDGVLPDEVIVDFDYLNKSKKECLYGLVDVLSIYNALKDWQLANMYGGLKIDNDIFGRAQELLREAADIGNYMSVSDKPVDMELFNIIKEAGYITNDYGSGRPESGSEHIFASALEIRYKHDIGRVIPHAMAVSIGILIMTYFYDLYCFHFKKKEYTTFECVNHLMKKFVFCDLDEYKLRYSYIFDVLCSLTPRKDKYTLVDTLVYKLGGISVDNFKKLSDWMIECGITIHR